MIDLEKQKKNFENHIATFTDYGNIKILDFKNPESSHYRIRFLFEEDYCRLHISGDLGELTATNYNNMRFQYFDDHFTNDPWYFESKINCMNRPAYVYNEKTARKELLDLINEAEIEESIAEDYDNLDDFLDYVLEYFDDDKGIDQNGYDIFSRYYDDFFEEAWHIGKERTGIIELYLLAFGLAIENLKQGEGK